MSRIIIFSGKEREAFQKWCPLQKVTWFSFPPAMFLDSPLEPSRHCPSHPEGGWWVRFQGSSTQDPPRQQHLVGGFP